MPFGGLGRGVKLYRWLISNSNQYGILAGVRVG